MFGRKKKKDGGIEAFLGPETIFQGTINTKGTLRIDGRWEGGTVNAQGVIIGENGMVTGNINAGSVIIGGKVTGNIIASEMLEIHSRGEVKGDIKTAHLSIADGAIFEGNCSMIREEKIEPTEEASLKTHQVFLPEK